MKLSDFLADFLAVQSIKHVFVLQGGAALHLIDSIAKKPNIQNVTMQHEQACSMAADGYARVYGLGCTVVTSGPGATNLLTGIAVSYFDSIPTLHITGNVSSFRLSKGMGVRQYGFQETDIVNVAAPICKYAIQIQSPDDIYIALKQAIKHATTGRKGPVLIDIPDDFQRAELNDDEAKLFLNDLIKKTSTPVIDVFVFMSMFQTLKNSKRPIAILGAGLLENNTYEQVISFCHKIGLPYLITWPLKGVASSNDSLFIGSFGTHSYRGNNIVLQNSDFILSIGCRLDSRATAKLDTFARNAKVCMVDIDETEINKFDCFSESKFSIAFKFPVDAKFFIEQCDNFLNDNVDYFYFSDDWFRYIDKITQKYNRPPVYDLDGINPYMAAENISRYFSDDQVVVVDTGTCLPLSMVYGVDQKGQKYLTSFNNTPMGYALPCAIGVAVNATNPVVCITGDGGLQMNIQELATLCYIGCPVYIFVYNNKGHSMIKQTQDDWLDACYESSSVNSGIPSIAFSDVAKAYGIDSYSVGNNEELGKLLPFVFASKKPILIDMQVNEHFRYEPIIKYGNGLENMSPLLPAEQIEKDTIIV
ncbi:thiamine pyrophosphate-binding protein [Algibacillus agarilyticus]|uniref:thiamine pyrophosphate-binding protein n=1 Tax=Algibacillus agarilyticus TaxID=2234133 RepID=UPI000DD04CDB|nr:thiamine pyrophosphate-binding protein [Algibacillus agarilyticus]